MPLADFAAGVNKSLQDMILQRLERDKFAELTRVNRAREAQDQADLEQRRTYQTAQLASMADQRDALAEQRRQNAAHVLTGDLNVGDPLDDQQQTTLRAGNLGSLVESQPATLPSRSTTGFLRAAPGGAVPPTGVLRTSTQPGHAAGTIYRGTPSQRRTFEQRQELQRFIETLPANSPERRALEYQLQTGDNPPAGMFQRDVTPSFQLQPLYDETGRPSGAIKFNQRTGDVTPVDLPGKMRAPGRGLADDPELPRGVGNYLVQLRSKYGSYEQAIGELTRALPEIQQTHPSFNAVKAGNALRQLFGQPVGTGGFDLSPELLSMLGRGAEAASGGRSQTPAASAAASGQVLTRTELQGVAKRLGISEHEAEQQARARGMQVQ